MFVTGVLSGKIRIVPVPSLPTVSASEDCAAIHAQADVAVEDEVDLADILSEDVGEDTRAKKADVAEDDSSALEEAEKRELELKRKKAMEEIAKLNKASNKDKKKKKKRGKGKKDEL